MKALGVIPARLQSSRLPRKLLLSETGKPLIQHTWEAARLARSLDAVVVATDSREIFDAVRRFGGQCELTGEHPSGTDRIAEIVRRSSLAADVDVVVNIQGDEPEIDPRQIDTLVSLLANSPDAEMATLATPINAVEQLRDASCTKVVCDSRGHALYFSRLPIPFSRDELPEALLRRAEFTSPWLLHLGVYAYRPDFLLALTRLPPSPLEQLEKLEQLRALQAGATIKVASIEYAAVGIDTPEDYARFLERHRRRAA